MATKTSDLDITAFSGTVLWEDGYEKYRILVRAGTRPLGWISLEKDQGPFSPGDIQEAIKKQIGLHAIEQALSRRFEPVVHHAAIPESISVVVCTRNRTKQLTACLEALLLCEFPSYEIIVVDNAPSNDDTRDLAATLPVRYVREETPGLDWARNRGIKEAAYDIVAFTDDDVRVDRGWLRAIGKTFMDPEVMGASGFVAPAELETPAQHLFELGYGGMGKGVRRRVMQKDHMSEKQLIWTSNFCIGANMAFRKKVFNETGGFDTSLDVGTPSHGGGDLEFFHRLLVKGFVSVYEPSMLIWHYHRREDAALRRQIFDNGRGFGCYLIKCARQGTVSRLTILQVLLKDWLLDWNLKNLVRPGKVPRSYSLLELYGMLTSPFAYLRTRWRDRKIRRHR